MKSAALSVDEYLTSLPDDRREAIQALRRVILKNMDPRLEEGMTYGMIGYYVPLRDYPAGYHCDPTMPLPYANLGSQKNHIALYSMPVYGHPETLAWLQKAWKATGKKLDMGKSCIRFKSIDDVPLEVVGELFRKVSVKAYIEQMEALLSKMGKGPKKPDAKKTAKIPSKSPAKTKAPAKKTTTTKSKAKK